MTEQSQDRPPFETERSDVIAEQVARARGETGKRPEPTRERPLYPSEVKRRGNKATYDVGADVIAGVKEIAMQERVGGQQSRVARALLAYAIDAYNAGRFTLEVHHDGSDWWLEAAEK